MQFRPPKLFRSVLLKMEMNYLKISRTVETAYLLKNEQIIRMLH